MSSSKASREEWLERVRAWTASGLSCAEFARRRGVNAQTLSWWRWRLRREGQRLEGPGKAEPPLALVEVSPALQRLWPAAETERVELEVDGIRVRVPDGFEAATLTRVLAVLEARR
jgi:transposase-like protein